MKTTISGRPNNHSLEFPCLMFDRKDSYIIVYVTLNTDIEHPYQVITLTGPYEGCGHRYAKVELFDRFEYFTGQLILEND